jgi:putative zinc-dependent peptidase DUF5700
VRRLLWAMALGLLGGCAGGPSGKSALPVPAAGKAPYDASPAGANVQIDITLDVHAAREILGSLARSRVEASDVKVLEDLPAVRWAIEDSTRTADIFERDFAVAFESETHAAVFDFRSIRERRERWQALLDTVVARQGDLLGLARRRAASLIPGDRPASAKLQVFLSFGLAGLEDHLVLRKSGGVERMVIDFARALGEAEGGAVDLQISRLSRLIAGVAFRQAWNEYRESSPAWRGTDPQLGQLEPLLKIVAAGGPVGLFAIDENFFPLSVWLKDAGKRALDDLNHRADRMTQAQDNLEERVALAAEIRKPDFARRLAAPIGAFLADAITQDAGTAGLREALQEGPRGFFRAYDRATQKDKNLIPLTKSIRDKLK